MPSNPFELLHQYSPISTLTFERLSIYHNLLLKWQRSINLVSTDSLSNAWQRHFLDSLQLLKLIENHNRTTVDIGTGGGFPGMVLAICGVNDMQLIESDGKKIAFLREVARLTETKVSIHHCRAKDYISESTDMIISRACDSLDNLLTLSSHLVSRGTRCLFPKGKNHPNEIKEAKNHWAFDIEIIPSITDSEGVILKLTHITKRVI